MQLSSAREPEGHLKDGRELAGRSGLVDLNRGWPGTPDTLRSWMPATGRPLTTPDGRLALRMLEDAGETGVTVAELRTEGLQMPAQALYEVELAGWPLERKAGRTRLRPHDAPPPKPFQMPPKVRLVPRG
jgi:hypothetical protein